MEYRKNLELLFFKNSPRNQLSTKKMPMCFCQWLESSTKRW